MISKIFTYLFLMILGIVTQAHIFPEILRISYAPDLLIVLAIAGALTFSPLKAHLLAFLCGLIADFSSAIVVGPQAAGFLFASILTQQISKQVYSSKYFSLALLSASAVIVKEIVNNLYIFAFSKEASLGPRLYYMLQVLPFEVLTTAIIAPFIIKIFINRMLSGKN